MNTPYERFLSLVGRILDGEATEAEREAFRRLLREHPELIEAYREQVDIDTLAYWKFGRKKATAEVTGTRRSATRWKKAWWKVAAAAAAVVAATVWLTTTARRSEPPSLTLRRPEELASFAQATAAKGISLLRSGYGGQGSGGLASGSRSPASGPVALMHGESITGLDLPSRLPGTVRLERGQATVRLGSGVALTLLGPLELEVRDAMLVRLQEGRLLAEVPQVASGFTVQTPELEMWDIGTVFGVSVSNGMSDVFVFKGSVQVNEASGEPVDLCGTGEGVRVVAGRPPLKIAADWGAARDVFSAVRGNAALRQPQKAFEVLAVLAGMWTERYLSGPGLLPENVVKGNGIPFERTAWVRPSVSAVQQEENSMKTTRAVAAVAATAIVMGAEMAGAVSEPTMIDTSWSNRRWTTVYTNAVALAWDWPGQATHAYLEIAGMETVFTTNFTEVTSGYLWQAFASAAPRSEDVYGLTLTFWDAGENVVGALTSRLAVISGAFGPVAVNTSPDTRRWTQVKGNAVIPYDAGWAAATADARDSRLAIGRVGSAAQTNLLGNASGYYGWKLKGGGCGYGTYGLSLTFPGAEGEWDAVLTYVPSGTMISVR